jgi:hypothetical protein
MNAIESVEQELSEATARAQQLIDSTDARLFTVRPHPSSWSASECIAHLNLSTELFLPVLRQTFDEARKRGLTARGEPSMDWLGRILRWFLEPPVRSRVKTTAPFVPKAVRAKAESKAEFVSLQSQLLALVREAADLPLSRLKVVSPFDKRVRYNVFSAFRIIAAHQRRHLWQAEQAVAELRRRQTAA